MGSKILYRTIMFGGVVWNTHGYEKYTSTIQMITIEPSARWVVPPRGGTAPWAVDVGVPGGEVLAQHPLDGVPLPGGPEVREVQRHPSRRRGWGRGCRTYEGTGNPGPMPGFSLRHSQNVKCVGRLLERRVEKREIGDLCIAVSKSVNLQCHAGMHTVPPVFGVIRQFGPECKPVAGNYDRTKGGSISVTSKMG